MARLDDLRRFYAILDRLSGRCGGPRTLAECDGRMSWPSRGIYFFFEPGEHRSDTGEGLRVVRVGTHALTAASRTSLWQRLSQHRGTRRRPGGNHRGSIFRLLIGAALIQRDPSLRCPSWGQGGSAPRDVREGERAIETLVSRHVGAMPFLWLAVDDTPGPESLRGYLERNAIALLSNKDKPALDPPSSAWLGNHCPRDRVRNSGLWNQNHVDEAYEPAFLDVLEELVE